mmetsp:Transcript_15703/g.36005  ORF Transcript_15703/g.36005 Transcript_15703/m.36005 type:complete len:289 (-) Transcript_15703:760-1626(-)
MSPFCRVSFNPIVRTKNRKRCSSSSNSIHFHNRHHWRQQQQHHRQQQQRQRQSSLPVGTGKDSNLFFLVRGLILRNLLHQEECTVAALAATKMVLEGPRLLSRSIHGLAVCCPLFCRQSTRRWHIFHRKGLVRRNMVRRVVFWSTTLDSMDTTTKNMALCRTLDPMDDLGTGQYWRCHLALCRRIGHQSQHSHRDGFWTVESRRVADIDGRTIVQQSAHARGLHATGTIPILSSIVDVEGYSTSGRRGATQDSSGHLDVASSASAIQLARRTTTATPTATTITRSNWQ